MSSSTASPRTFLPRRIWRRSLPSVRTGICVHGIVKKKQDMVVPASEEKKHKKLVQKLKDEESVGFANDTLLFSLTARL